MIAILVVDDHPVVRCGLKQILAEEADMTVVGEAANAEDMLAFVRRQPYNVVILDISLPGRSGLEALKELRRARRTLRVLVLSVHPERQYALRALHLGAAGYLSKESVSEELVTAIRRVATGGRYVSQSIVEEMAWDLVTHAERPRHENLSEREYRVFTMIAGGKMAKEIAAELALGVRTIRKYTTQVLEKLAMKNKAELIQYAVSNRLVD